MRNLFAIAFLFANSLLLAQGKIHGNVFYQSSGYTPAIGVKVNANGSNGDYSKSDGAYTLAFSSFSAGATIYPSIGDLNNIAKDANGKDVELVNAKELEYFNIPEDPAKTPMKIIVCPKGARDLSAQKYYRIIKTDADAQLEKKRLEIKVIRAKLGLANALVLEKQKQLEAFENLNDSIRIYKEALEIASINRDGAKKRVLSYLDALDAGLSIEEARKELNTANAYREAQQAIGDIDASLEEIRLKAKSYEAELKFTEAIGIYDTIGKLLAKAKRDPLLIVDNYITLGKLNNNIQKNDKAFQYLNLGLEILNNDYSPEHQIRAELLLILGQWYYGSLKYKEVEKNYLESIKIYEILSKINPIIFEKELALAQNSLGVFYKTISEYGKSEVWLRKSLELFRKQANADSEEYNQGLAMVLTNLGPLYGTMGNFQEAEKMLLEALEIRKFLVHFNPRFNKGAVAPVLINLGFLYSDFKLYDKAETAYLESLNILKPLAQENPSYFGPSIGKNQTSLGVLYLKLKRYEEAELFFSEALGVFRELGQDNPEHYLNQVANTLYGIGNLYKLLKRFGKAEATYMEAMVIEKQILERNPEHFDYSVPKAQLALGTMYYELEDYNNSAKTLSNALKLFPSKRKEDQPYYASCHHILGIIHYKLKQEIKGDAEFEEALRIYIDLVKIDSAKYEPEVANISSFLAVRYKELKQYSKSISNYLIALEAQKKLAVTNPELQKPRVVYTLVELGFIYGLFQEFQKAETLLNEALTELKVLGANNPLEYNKQIAATISRLCTVKKYSYSNNPKLDIRDETLQLIKLGIKVLKIYDESDSLAQGLFEELRDYELFFSNLPKK